MNYWAILACGVIAQALGAFWYSPLAFGKRWMKQMGWEKLSKKQIQAKQKEAMPGYIGSFIGSLVTASVIAFLFGAMDVQGWLGGVQMGALLWLGFVATTMAMPSLWENRSWCMYRMGVAYYLIQLMLFGAVLASW